MGIFKNMLRSRDKPKNALPGSRYNFLFGGSSAGRRVNENTAMQMSAVYACVRVGEHVPALSSIKL